MINISRDHGRVELQGSLMDLEIDVAQAILALYRLKVQCGEYDSDGFCALLDVCADLTLLAKSLYDDPEYRKVLEGCYMSETNLTGLARALDELQG